MAKYMTDELLEITDLCNIDFLGELRVKPANGVVTLWFEGEPYEFNDYDCPSADTIMLVLVEDDPVNTDGNVVTDVVQFKESDFPNGAELYCIDGGYFELEKL